MTLAEWAERDEDAEGELVDGELVQDELWTEVDRLTASAG
jgi:hypothetical protein